MEGPGCVEALTVWLRHFRGPNGQNRLRAMWSKSYKPVEWLCGQPVGFTVVFEA